MSKENKMTGISMALLVPIFKIGVGGLFSGKIRTLRSFKVLNNQPFCEMTYHADYDLDEFLKNGAATDNELVSFINKKY